jgi:hypothetical protein
MTDANPLSILDSVKKVLGFDPDYTFFDLDILMHINSAFGSLQQIGVGGDTGFWISDNTTLWSQYVSSYSYLGMIQQYIYMSVRMAFDVPTTSFAIGAFEKQIEELAWRINIAAEHINPPSNPFAPENALDNGVTTTFFKVRTVTIEYASVMTPDAGVANTFHLTLDGNATLNAPINGVEGEHITILLIANGHTITWGAGWDFGDAGEPTLSSGGKTDIISAVCQVSTTEWFAGFTPGF